MIGGIMDIIFGLRRHSSQVGVGDSGLWQGGGYEVLNFGLTVREDLSV